MSGQMRLFIPVDQTSPYAPPRRSGKRPEHLAGELDDLDLQHAERVIAAELNGAMAPRPCDCARSIEIRDEDEGRCLKCGRGPR